MARARPCEACGAPLDSDQRYCLPVRDPARPGDPQLDELLQTAAARAAADARRRRVRPAAFRPPPLDGASLSQARGSRRCWCCSSLASACCSAAPGRGGHVTAATARRSSCSCPPAPARTRARAAASEATPKRKRRRRLRKSEPKPHLKPRRAPRQRRDAPKSQRAPKRRSRRRRRDRGQEDEAGRSSPTIKHVFVIVLSDEPYAADFGPESKATLPRAHARGQGRAAASLRRDRTRAVAERDRADQRPGADARRPRPTARPTTPLRPRPQRPDGQVLGDGCVYPAVRADAARAAERPSTSPGAPTCRGSTKAPVHPGPPARTPARRARPDLRYGRLRDLPQPLRVLRLGHATAACESEDVGLERLAPDLVARPQRTPTFSYIVPDRCDDGGPTACAPGAPAGAADADEHAEHRGRREIMTSTAYKRGGLIVDHLRRGPLDGRIRRLELLLRPAAVSQPRRRPDCTTAAAWSARCCSRRS